jgi:hypothetical protein
LPVFELQREVRKIRELGRLALGLTPDRSGRGSRRTALLLHDVGQLVRHEFPTAAGLRRELARSEDNVAPDGKCPRVNRSRQPRGVGVGVDADVAEVVAEPRSKNSRIGCAIGRPRPSSD